MKEAKPVRGTDVVLKASNMEGDVRIQYSDQPGFERIARQFGVFEEWKVNYCFDIYNMFCSSIDKKCSQ